MDVFTWVQVLYFGMVAVVVGGPLLLHFIDRGRP